MKDRTGIIWKAAAIALMALALTACTTSCRAEDLGRENYEQIETRMKQAILEKTNLSAVETEEVWEALGRKSPKIHCKQYRDWRRMARERHETAETCTVKLKTREPIALEIEAEYWVYLN